MTGRRLLLVRHGVTDWNREGRFQGHLDPPLSKQGRAEARLLGERLADVPHRPARIVASSLSRAVETAELIANARGGDWKPTVSRDARLIEIGQGQWEGRTHAELAVADAERYAAWRTHEADRSPPGAESIDAVVTRLDAAMREHGAGGDWPLCLVSHGGTLRLLARALLGLSARRAWTLDLDNASLSVLTDDGSGTWRLERWNDTRHVLGRMPTHVSESEGEPLAL